jgi:hypothetical protein
MSISAKISLVYQPFKATIAVFIPETVDVIVTHLVDYNAYYQFGCFSRFLTLLGKQRRKPEKGNQGQDKCFFHTDLGKQGANVGLFLLGHKLHRGIYHMLPSINTNVECYLLPKQIGETKVMIKKVCTSCCCFSI